MRLITYALAASVLALAAGCGGGDATVSTNPTSAANMPAMSDTAPYSQGASASGNPSGAQMSGDGEKATDGDDKSTGGDSAAEKKYEDLEAKLAKNDGDAKLKIATAEAAYEAGHYIEYDKPGLSPREKYRPALKLYNRALELNPKHEKAAMEKKQIESIYTQMGMPIPK